MLLTTLKNVELSETQNFAKGGSEKLGGRKEIGTNAIMEARKGKSCGKELQRSCRI